MNKEHYEVAFIIIGDEILSGRTRDSNLQTLALGLAEKGYFIKKSLIIPDIKQEIIEAVNLFREKYSLVFTSGGIGPTHDDITLDAIADAFSLPLEINSEAEKILQEYYKKLNYPFNEARRKMAKAPYGSSLIKNSISAAPGFKIQNVYSLAGIPSIFKVMLEEIVKTLPEGAKMYSESLIIEDKSEGVIAETLSLIQRKFFGRVLIGSYPFFNEEQTAYNVEVIFKSADPELAKFCKDETLNLLYN